MGYRELHTAAERALIERLRRAGHFVLPEARKDHDVIFDVYDATTDTAWEVLTAKFFRSAHEQDEAVIAKIFRYLMWCRRLNFLVVSVDDEDLPLLHNLGLEHWHCYGSWWSGEVSGWRYHRGKSAREIVKAIYAALVRFAPIAEWCRERRRAAHPKAAVEKEFDRITRALGLPKNFLIGLWRDWRLQWVWKLEKILPRWRLQRVKSHQI